MVLDENTKKEVEKILEDLEKEVVINYFKTSDKTISNSEYVEVIEELIKEVEETSPKVKTKVYSFPEDKEVFEKKGIPETEIPTISFENYDNIRYLGIPSGHEFSSFLETIKLLGGEGIKVDKSVALDIAKVKEPLEIYVFVTPSCPYCPLAVNTSHRFAFLNKNITSKMVEALEYRELAEKHSVMAVPKIVIYKDGVPKVEFEGAYPEDMFAKKVLEALGENED